MRLKRILVEMLVSVALLALTSCATVVRGTKQTVRIESHPEGATLHLSTGEKGLTPATFELARKQPIVVEFTKEGYEPQSFTLVPVQLKSGSMATAGNGIIGGAIGGAIDGSTGAALDLQPNPLVVTLRAIRNPATPANWAGLQIGLARRDVRELLGEPIAISDATGNQVWTYADGGSVQFHHFFVTVWSAPKPTS